MGTWKHQLSAAVLATWASACAPTFETCNDDSDCQNGTTCASGGCFAVGRDGGVDSDGGVRSDGGVESNVDAGIVSDIDAGIDGGPVVPLECEPGFADNGLGVCAPAGECAAGFAAVYVDVDGDGVGVEFFGCTDAAEDPAAGTARVSGDCDDDDAAVFRAATLFFDGDTDGTTSASAAFCLGASDPPDAVAASTAPLVLLAHPVDGDSVNVDDGTDEGDWDDAEDAFHNDAREAEVDLDNDSISEWLRVSGFACLGDVSAYARVDTVEITVRVRVDRPGPVRVTGRLVRGGVASAEFERVVEVGGVRRDVTVGGPITLPGDFQCTRSGAGRVNLDVRFSPVEESPGDVRVDSVSGILKDIDGDVFDCNDDDDDGAALVDCFLDLDGDRAGRVASNALRCTNAALGGYAPAGTDCDDDDARAFPGQGAFFFDPRADGSYDFNCDGSSTPRAISSASICTPDAATGMCSVLSGIINGSCGGTVEAGACDGTCTLTSTLIDQSCR